jgi:hypothetical protein
LRIKEQETRLTLHEEEEEDYDDDNDDEVTGINSRGWTISPLLFLQ